MLRTSRRTPAKATTEAEPRLVLTSRGEKVKRTAQSLGALAGGFALLLVASSVDGEPKNPEAYEGYPKPGQEAPVFSGTLVINPEPGQPVNARTAPQLSAPVALEITGQAVVDKPVQLRLTNATEWVAADQDGGDVFFAIGELEEQDRINGTNVVQYVPAEKGGEPLSATFDGQQWLIETKAGEVGLAGQLDFPDRQ